MIRALWFYGLRSSRNNIVKRTRDARYIVGMVLAAGYVYWIVGRETRRAPNPDSGEMLGVFFTVFLLGAIVVFWFFGSRDHPLALTKAQAQTLIPAPLTSRELMLFRMATVLPQITWSALIFGLLARGFSSHLAPRLAAAFLALVALQLMRVGAALARGDGRTGARTTALVIVRAWLVVAIPVCVAQILSLAAGERVFGFDLSRIPFSLASVSPWSLPLWPFRVLLAPAYADTVAQFVPAFGLALLLVAVEALLVFQMSPEWNRIGIARTREEKRSAQQRKGRKKSAGGSIWQRYVTSLLTRPATALAWKNLISAGRTQPLTLQLAMVLGIPVILAATLVPSLQDLTPFAAGMAASGAGLLLFMGPLLIRNDLRLDLPRLRLLRTYPLTSLEICAAEVGASASLLTLLQLALLVLSTPLLVLNPALPLPTGEAVAFAIALACLLPGMNAINLAAQNLFAILFPKWVTLGTKPPDASANPGQFYITFLISAGLFLLSMILPAIGAGVVGYQLRPFGNSIAVVAAALVAGAITLGEAGLVMKWMASLLDRVDINSVRQE